MKKGFLFVLVLFAALNTAVPLVQAHGPQEVSVGGKTFYVVTSMDPDQNSGDKVCALAGKQCVGYTAFDTNVCKAVHPTAATKSDMNGSKAGFYCDGAPQGGVCASEKNTCHICPNCNVNADCSTQIGDLYREMYVECSGGDEAAATASESAADIIPAPAARASIFSLPGRWWDSFRSTVARAFDLFREKLGRLTMVKIQHATVQVQGADGSIVSADIPVDSFVCEFYQQNKKMVTCGALGAADSFCVKAFDSRFAKAELCQDNGVIVCSKPCTTNPQELAPQRCAFDGDRPRGNQAPPLNFCTETITVDTTPAATKKAGEVCEHGGQCATGYCLGQPSDSGIKYFCSCKQSTLDFTCGK